MNPNLNGHTREHLSRNRVRGLVKSIVVELGPHRSIADLSDETAIGSDLIRPILDRLGYFLDCNIPLRSKPRGGWKISTVVGYVYHQQDSFPKVQTAQ